MRRGTVLLAMLAAGVISAPGVADAYLARAPLRRVLAQANPDLVACRERHSLEDGRYAVRLVVDPTGKVSRVELTAGPVHPGPAAESCIAAAFTRLRFVTGYTPAPSPAAVDRRSGGGRRSAVPRDPRRMSSPRGGIIVINWPFVFSP